MRKERSVDCRMRCASLSGEAFGAAFHEADVVETEGRLLRDLFRTSEQLAQVLDIGRVDHVHGAAQRRGVDPV